jgi:hypothetical protein
MGRIEMRGEFVPLLAWILQGFVRSDFPRILPDKEKL